MSKGYLIFIQDLGIVVLSIFVAVILAQTGILNSLLASMGGLSFLGSFIAGFFFTSIFTTAPAIAALGEIARTHSLTMTAIFGALGAVCGDLVIFLFMKKHISRHVSQVVQAKGLGRRFGSLLKLRSFRWLTFLVGGLVIASPLPDEVGLSLLGFSKIKTSWFLPLSLVFNFIGIFLAGMAARAVL